MPIESMAAGNRPFMSNIDEPILAISFSFQVSFLFIHLELFNHLAPERNTEKLPRLLDDNIILNLNTANHALSRRAGSEVR